MLQHHKGTSGYAYLYLILILCVCLASGLFVALGSMLGLQSAGTIAGGIIFSAFWIIGFIVMQRFLAIENRRPTLSESNIIGVKSVLTVFGLLFCIGVSIGLVIFIVNLISSLGAEGGCQCGRKWRPTRGSIFAKPGWWFRSKSAGYRDLMGRLCRNVYIIRGSIF